MQQNHLAVRLLITTKCRLLYVVCWCLFNVSVANQCRPRSDCSSRRSLRTTRFVCMPILVLECSRRSFIDILFKACTSPIPLLSYPHVTKCGFGKPSGNKIKLCSGPSSLVHIFNVWLIIMKCLNIMEWKLYTPIALFKHPKSTL